MKVEIVTKEDLNEFRTQLLIDIKALLDKPKVESSKWLKSYQVKNLLKISPNTLQKLKLNGTLKFTKIGGIHYYKYEDILSTMDGLHAH